MMRVEFDMFVHIVGEVEVDKAPNVPGDLLGAIFPEGFEGEVLGATTQLGGYMNVYREEDHEAD